MELKLVYRILRKVSDWTLAGFYSEVYIEGQENIQKHNRLIVVSSHHNEMIDIATLAVTIPHRRHVCFWAKASMYVNPIARAVLLSSGSIPVQRNPDGAARSKGTSSAPSITQASLFRETTAFISKRQVVGVFPEATSYTEPRIMQVKEGAAWAAVEYIRWATEAEKTSSPTVSWKGLSIVPVAIVYTNKSRYQSRIYVKYGKPISVDDYGHVLDSDPNMDPHAVVKSITQRIEKQLLEMTVNAPDWDTLHSARMARDILWDDERNIPLKKFVQVSQKLIDVFSQEDPSYPDSLLHLRRSLIKYLALLYYCKMTHSSLASTYPTVEEAPTIPEALFVVLTRLVTTILHPRFILFLPPLLVHIPAYLTGSLASRFLATRGEEEGQAQFKAIFGGLGMGLGYSSVAYGVIKSLVNLGDSSSSLLARLADSSRGKFGDLFSVLKRLGSLLRGDAGNLKQLLGIVTVTCGTAWALFRWHNSLVGGNYRQYKRLSASLKVLSGALSPRSSDIPLTDLEAYSTPPPPPVNPYIKRRSGSPTSGTSITSVSNNSSSSSVSLPAESSESPRRPPMAVSSRRLIRHLFAARKDATLALGQYLAHPTMKDTVDFLEVEGAKIRRGGCL